MQTAYDVLGVPRKASPERIRTAFCKAAKGCHPDLNAGDPTADLQIRQIITAYEILKIPHRRAAYDQHLRERRRERARHCAMAAVVSLLRCSIVALAISLSASQSNTQAVSAPPTQDTISTKIRPDASQQLAAADNLGRQELKKGPKSDWGAAPEHGPRHRLDTLAPTFGPPELYATLAREWVLEASGEPMASAGHAHSTEPAKSELIVLINAATPVSSKSLEKPLLEERTTKFVSSHTASRSSTSTSDLRSLARAYADNVLYNESHKSRQTILLEKSRELAHWPERVYDVQRQATQHRYKQRIASDDSPSPDQRAGKSNPRASIGPRYPLVLPGGPNELFALLVSQRLTPKTPGPPPSNVVGEGGRADSYKTQQIALTIAPKQFRRNHTGCPEFGMIPK